VHVGIRHGTVQIQVQSRGIEITSFDTPGEEGILKDLGRRDFTMNALALYYPGGILLDPHKGREDLRRGLIRGVGEARERFAEDPLRVVRAARMAGTYGFAVDPATFEAMRDEAENLEHVAGERIRDELCKILLAPHTIEAFDLLRKAWALGKILPELAVRGLVHTAPDSGLSIYRYALLCVIHCPVQLRVRLAALFHASGVPADGARGDSPPIDYREASAYTARERMKKWRMSNRQIDDVSTLIEHQLPLDAPGWSDAEIRRFLSRVDNDLLDDFLALAEAGDRVSGRPSSVEAGDFGARMREQARTATALRVEDLAIGGGDIMDILGLSQGPEVGRVLRRLFSLVLEDPGLNRRDVLVQMVKRDFARR